MRLALLLHSIGITSGENNIHHTYISAQDSTAGGTNKTPTEGQPSTAGAVGGSNQTPTVRQPSTPGAVGGSSQTPTVKQPSTAGVEDDVRVSV